MPEGDKSEMLYLEADKGTGGGGSAQDGSNTEQATEQKPQDFDSWLASQPEDVKTLLSGHTAGLKNALKSERDARSDLEKQLRDLAAKSEKDSDAQKQLTSMADQMGEADRKAGFYEAAHAAGVKNLKLAYTVAVSDEMFDRRGNINFQAMKEAYPELFGGVQKAPTGNAGSGAGGGQTTGISMNDFIRRKAGRQ
jgi:hypothetical protein